MTLSCLAKCFGKKMLSQIVTSLLFRFIAGIGSLAKTIWTSQRNSFKQNLIKVGFLSFRDEADAQQKYPHGVGLGKLGIAFSDSRPPRLVLDSSICNSNQNCWIPERQCYPSARDVVECFPLRNCSEPQHAATFDVKSAHKRIVVAEHHQGLVGFTFRGKIFFHRVCPVGATFSAFWWG